MVAVLLLIWSLVSVLSDVDAANYPYWCRDCKAVFDREELEQPDNWKRAPGSPSDSVVLCLRCKEGWAFPAPRCPKCSTPHVLYLIPDSRCPVCEPEVAAKAREAGVELVPPELK